MTLPAVPPNRHAATIMAWLGRRRLADVHAALATLRGDHPLFAAADALADAADSDDLTVRASGLTALFAGVVEPLNDGFTPAGRALYAHLMARIVWRVASRVPELLQALGSFRVNDLSGLSARYSQARAGRSALPEEPITRIVVLSRVTIGADILLSSVVLQRLHQRYPEAELVLLGDAKLSALFGGLPQVRVRPLSYARRGPLRERLSSWLTVLEAVRAESPQLVVAPDSRLDQLGVLPVCVEQERYLLWENLQEELPPAHSLCHLLDRWLCGRFGGVSEPKVLPQIAFDARTSSVHERLAAAFGPMPLVTVKLDHGGNPAKALPRDAELALLKHLRAQGWRILLDRGFGPDELRNSDELVRALGVPVVDIDDGSDGLGQAIDKLQPRSLADAEVVRFHGSIGGWAAGCACATLAISYDSVGHHLAAALGIPVIVAFTGFSDPDFPVAWQPCGRSPVSLIEISSTEKHLPESWQSLLAAIPAPGASLDIG